MGFSFGGAGRSSGNRFSMSNIANLVLRFLQIIFALVVIGLYAQDLNKAGKVGGYSDSKWVFAVVVGSMAAITALAFAVIGFFSQYRTVAMLFGWEWILVILWAAVAGVFGSMYLKEDPEGDGGVQRMKTAAIFDIINLIFWFITAVVGTVIFFTSGRKSLHTGRANL